MARPHTLAGGRPAESPEGERRAVRLSVPVTPAEAERIRIAAGGPGGVAAWLRGLALAATPPPTPPG